MKRKLTAFLLCFAFLVTMLPTAWAAETGDLTVTVRALAGASVTLDGTTVTAADGTATFAKKAGDYAFSVTKSGYAPVNATLSVTDTCTVDCNLLKADTNILSGCTVTGYSAKGYYGGSATPAKACNGNYSDGWQSAEKSEGDYLQVMFSGTKTLGSMKLFWERGSRPHKSNDGFTVQITTDGETFEVYHGTTYTYAADTSRNGIDGDLVDFGGVVCKGVRVQIDGYQTNYSPKLYEITAEGVTKSTFTVTRDGTDARIGALGAQISQPDNGKLRLLCAVDSLDYLTAGFEVTADDGRKTDHADHKVYRDAYTLESERFGVADGYLFSLIVTDLPDTFSLRVRPYLLTFDGERVYGRLSTVSRGADGELSVRSKDAYYLESGWQMSRVPDVTDKGAAISKNGYAAGSAWIPASVPSTVLTNYYHAGKIKDPNYDDNILDLDEDYYNVDYWYRTTFTVPKDLANQRIFLNFDGINWKADVYVNGQKIGDIKGAFIRGKFDVTELVTVGKENSLAVYLYWCNGDVADMPSFLCTKSWDFMPAIPGRDVGIYKEVYLTGSGDVTIQDAMVSTDLPLPDTSKATAAVSTFAENHAKTAVTGTLKGVIRRDDGTGSTYAVEKTVTLAAGEKKEIFFDPLCMTNPDLWWPVGAGDQPLYKLTLTFDVNGAVSDTTVTDFGVREYTYRYQVGDLVINVNGQDIFIRGGNWAVPDNLLDWTDADFKDAVKMHADMGFNMIRNWHGANDFESFYHYCDRYGILVYEDFWLNGWEAPKDHDMYMSNVDDKVLRLRSHPCLCLWCGENEAKPWGPFDVEMPASIAKYDRDLRLYVAASNAGAVSGGINYALQSPAWYFEKAANFCTELGSTTIPTYDSVCRMFEPKNRTINAVSDANGAWNLRGWNVGVGNKVVGDYKNAVTNRYGGAGDFEEFCDICQLINFETYRAIFESFNDKMFEGTEGVLLWMSNPTWGSVLWQVYDSFKAQTGGYYGSKSACEPIHIQWSAKSNTVKVINNTASTVNASAVIRVYNLDGSVKYDKTVSVASLPNAATAVTSLGGISGLSQTYFIDLALVRDGETLSQNFYWANNVSGTNYKAMANMASANVTAETRVENHADGSATMFVTFKNTSSVCAVGVNMTLYKDKVASGEDARVLPAFYEDNWFSLVPGETRTLKIDYDVVDLHGASPILKVGGFNLGKGGGAGGTNVALLGTAIDSGAAVYDGTKKSSFINDGECTVNGYQPQDFVSGDWCGVQFDKAYTVTSLKLYWENSDDNTVTPYADGGYKISRRVGGEWKEVTGITSSRVGTVDTLTFASPVSADGVRVEILSMASDKYPPQLYELEIYAELICNITFYYLQNSVIMKENPNKKENCP